MTFLDRIKETSTSTGTGAFTLAGAVTGYKVFSNGTYKYCIVNALETEWEVGEGTVTSGVLTRTTVEASSNGGAAVNFTTGTKQVFNTVSATYVNSLVPYSGATASVNLGAYGLTSDYLQLSTTPTATGAVGRMLWNDTDGTMDIGLKGGNVTLQVGQEQVVRVVNKVGSTLTEAAYQAVYISGAQGQRPKVALAQANVDATSASTIGLVTETIADNQEGFITTSGIVRGINTTGSLQGETWADGDIVYLSPTTAGRITNVKPTAPNHTVVIGYVVHSHATQGKIFVKVDNGYELTELHDIYAPSPTTGQSIYWNATNSRYELNTIAGVLGYTPQAAITLTTTGTSGAATLVGNTLNIPQYAAGITGSGTAGQVTYWSGTSAVSGSSNLFWDNTNGRLSIGAGASPAQKLQVHGSMRVGTTAASAMYWDDTNNRLGIGVTSPSSTLHIQGAGNTSATFSLTVLNSDATGILRVRNDNKVLLNQLGFGNDFPEIFSTVSGAYDVNGGSLSFTSSQTNYGVASYNFYFRHVYSGKTFTSGTGGGILQNLGFSPTSGTGVFNQVALTGTINQTGGANGITRGLYVNPTITAAADFRAIETTNGKIIFGNLPTSSAGLPTGALWNNLGIVSIV